MGVGLASWCIYVSRYRRLFNNTYVPVAGPDEDVITLSYESCSILRRNEYSSSVKSLVVLSDNRFSGPKSALLASLLRLNNVKTYDVSDMYHLMNLAMELVAYGDVLVNVTDAEVAASVSIIVSGSRSPVDIIFSDVLINAVPLVPNDRIKGDFYGELYLNALSRFLSSALRTSSINPREIKHVATNFKDLRYCSKILRNVGIGEKALEPTKFVSSYAYFNSLHSMVSLIRSLEIALPGDNILYLDVDRNYNYVIASVFRVNEDLSKLHSCVLPLERLLDRSSAVVV